MSEPLQYNEFVRRAFARPEFVLSDRDTAGFHQSSGGDRETGVEFRLYLNESNHSLFYSVYGSPYAVAAGEWLCKSYASGEIQIGQSLDLEEIKSSLDMPYNYFFILLALEDAWSRLLT